MFDKVVRVEGWRGLIKREIAGDLQGIQVEGEDEEDDFKPIFNLWGLHGFKAQ